MRQIFQVLLAIAAAAWLSAPVAAQDYPSKPVKLLVAFGPGSASDMAARLLGKFLQERWKQSFVVETRPGANGVIGTEALKKSLRDGYTVGITTSSTVAAAPYLYKKLPYDPQRDLEHVGLVGRISTVALIAPGSPFKSLPELIAYAKANPGKVYFGHSDTSSLVPAELLRETAKLPIEGVSYKTIQAALTDLMGGQIQFMFANNVSAQPHIAGGRLLPIAVADPKRHPRLPQVPAVAEVVPGFEVVSFVGLAVPAGTPQDIVERLHRGLAEAQADPPTKAAFEKLGLTILPMTRKEYRDFVLRETGRWRDYVRAARIEPQ